MNGIWGGLSMVCKRHSVANNKYLLDSYDHEKKSKFIVYLSANNLYGRAMQECLSFKNFKWMSSDKLSVQFLSQLPDNGLVGCVV